MFEFATGKLSVLEKRIFDKLDQERMLKAPDYKTAFEVLYDTDLAEQASQTKEIEKIAEAALFELKNLFFSILEEKKVILFLFLKFDASNIKLALKKFGREEIEAAYIAWANEPPDKVEQWVFTWASRRFEANKSVQLTMLNTRNKIDLTKLPVLNPWVKKMIYLSLSRLKKLKPKEIEITTDRAYFKTRIALAEKIHPFLIKMVKAERKLKNINSLSEYLFEKARETSAGLLKVLSFYQRKLNGLHNIRLILFAKQNNIPIGELKDKLLPL